MYFYYRFLSCSGDIIKNFASQKLTYLSECFGFNLQLDITITATAIDNQIIRLNIIAHQDRSIVCSGPHFSNSPRRGEPKQDFQARHVVDHFDTSPMEAGDCGYEAEA